QQFGMLPAERPELCEGPEEDGISACQQFGMLPAERPELCEGPESRVDCVCRPGKRPCGASLRLSQFAPGKLLEPCGGSHLPRHSSFNLLNFRHKKTCTKQV
ncbi:hypothetical protein, partial [Rheinheimera sp.]|uniref:hypothetical protein n=1 Tax=Rheinheimera sp. TaxID=1869214 RepID=UPI00307D523E